MGNRKESPKHKQQENKSQEPKSKIEILFTDRKVLLPWYQVKFSVIYSTVRNLNLFEEFLLKIVVDLYVDQNIDLSLSQISEIMGLGKDRGPEILKSVLENLLLNRTLILQQNKSSSDMHSYTISIPGKNSYLLGKTMTSEQNVAVSLFYSPITETFVHEPLYNLVKSNQSNMGQLLVTNKITDYNGLQIDYYQMITPEIIKKFMQEFNYIDLNQSIEVSDYNIAEVSLQTDERTLRIGLDHKGNLIVELHYQDPEFNQVISNLIQGGEIRNLQLGFHSVSENGTDLWPSVNLFKRWKNPKDGILPLESINLKINAILKNKAYSYILVCDNDLNLEYLSNAFQCNLNEIIKSQIITGTLFILIKHNSTEYQFQKQLAGEKFFYQLMIPDQNNHCPPFIQLEASLFEVGNIILNEENSDQYLPLIKVGNRASFIKTIQSYYPFEELHKIGKDIIFNLTQSELNSDEVLELMSVWRDKLKELYDPSIEISDILLSKVKLNTNLDDTFIENFLQKTKKISLNEQKSVLDALIDQEIKNRPISFTGTQESFNNDLKLKKEIENHFATKVLSLESSWEKLFHCYFELFLESNDKDLWDIGKEQNENNIRNTLKNLSAVNLNSLNENFQKCLISNLSKSTSRKDLYIILSLFSIINKILTEEAKKYLENELESHLNLFVDLKIEIIEARQSKKENQKLKLEFEKFLDLIKSQLRIKIPPSTELLFSANYANKDLNKLNGLISDLSTNVDKKRTENSKSSILMSPSESSNENLKKKKGKKKKNQKLIDGNQSKANSNNLSSTDNTNVPKQIEDNQSKVNSNKINSTDNKKGTYSCIVLDGSNVSRWNDQVESPNIKNVLTCRAELLKHDIPQEKIITIFGPGIRPSIQDTENLELFEHMIKNKEAKQAPPGAYDDWFIIQYAKRNHGLIITNDRYNDHKKAHPEDNFWLKKICVSYIFDEGIIFGSNFEDLIKDFNKADLKDQNNDKGEME